MSQVASLEPREVFSAFEALSRVPRGSGNMSGVADFCMDFAARNGLRAIRDESDNVIIFKDGTAGYESAEPIILQGHLDMVCQKTEECEIDFLRDGLELYVEDGFLKARGTTLGADNGIAVAMTLAVLADKTLSHPPIEAVFTTDEEVGMLGAIALDTGVLKGKKMINLDSEDMDCMTVSCAGGSDFTAFVSLKRETFCGTELTVGLKGLAGGHSGVCIHEGRVNANMLAGRVLNHLARNCDLKIISVNGGDKCNAIPNACEIKLAVSDAEGVRLCAEEYLKLVSEEISAREPDFFFKVAVGQAGEHSVLSRDSQKDLIFALCSAPNGVREMSAEIKGLVETSLNLGILETEKEAVKMVFALRSNKKSALKALEETLFAFFESVSADCKTGGHYPPWEYNSKSELQGVYQRCYEELTGGKLRVEAIHAGLECGVFSDKIAGIDCIAVGPQMYDVHTVNERLLISSVGLMYSLLLRVLESCN